MKLIFSRVYQLFLVAVYLLVSTNAFAIDGSLSIMRGFSSALTLEENASTIAIGDPNLIGVTSIKPNIVMINGQETGSTSLTVFGKSGRIYQYHIQISNDIAQLRQLLYSIEKKVTVEDINGKIVLKGEVPTAAALSRVLIAADRFMSDSEEPDFKVISDQGGILAGNLDEKQSNPTNLGEKIAGALDDLKLGSQSVGSNRNGGGSSGRNLVSRLSNALNQKQMNTKGNIAQNISRASVITVANGKVMSLIKVRSQPKVEIQMRVVAVDREKTDKLGIDWRLDGNNVSVGSKLGGVVSTLPSGAEMFDGVKSTIDPGTSTMLGFFKSGNYFLSAFLNAVEERGAASTLSEPLLTAISGEAASFLVGGSIPIPLQEISPGNATSNAIVATYVDFIEFGLRLTVRPTVLENGKISIVLDQSISEPDYTRSIQVVGAAIPSFKQKTVSTVTESESGETWAVAGLLTEEDRKSLKSVPWISKVPIIGKLFENKDDSKTRNELMILVNARTIKEANSTTTNFDGEGRLEPTRNAKPAPEKTQPELSGDLNTVPKPSAKLPSDEKISLESHEVAATIAIDHPAPIAEKTIPAPSSQSKKTTKSTVVEIKRFLNESEKAAYFKKAVQQGLPNIPPERDRNLWRLAVGFNKKNQKEIPFLLPPEAAHLSVGDFTAINLYW